MTGPRPAGRRWTKAEDNELQELLATGKTAREIARKLNLTMAAIYARLQHYRKRPADTPLQGS